MSPHAADPRNDEGRPRVLRVISRMNVGGPARHAVILNSGLEERGFETLLVHGTVGADEGSFDHLPEQYGLATHRIPALGRRLHLLNDLRAFSAVFTAMRDFQPQIVHTHTAKAGALGRAAAAFHNLFSSRNRRIAVVHTFHGHVLEGYFSGIGSRLVRVAERVLSRITDCTIAISEVQRTDLVERFHVAVASRTVVIPLGLPLGALLALTPEDRARAHRDAGYDPAFIVGFVGRLVPIKQVALLIDAIALVRQELPQAHLMITGDGPERGFLEERAREAGVDDVTVFTGWRDDLAAIYAQLDVLALTSKNEGTPVALIEAMAAGVPIVATAVGGVPDVITDTETGLLTSQSARAIADALLATARDRAAAAQRAALARERVRERYSDRALVDRIAALYHELLQNPSDSADVRARLHEPA